MKRIWLFGVIIIVAVWLSSMACVLAGALTLPKWLSLVAPVVCPPGTAIQVETSHYSYHEPGESSVAISCVGEGVDQDVTLNAVLALWGLFLVPALPVATLVTLGAFWSLRKRIVRRTQAGAQVVNVVTSSGQTFTSVDDMPPDVRQAYEKAMRVLGDADGDGVPDILEGAAQVVDLRQQEG